MNEGSRWFLLACPKPSAPENILLQWGLIAISYYRLCIYYHLEMGFSPENGERASDSDVEIKLRRNYIFDLIMDILSLGELRIEG